MPRRLSKGAIASTIRQVYLSDMGRMVGCALAAVLWPACAAAQDAMQILQKVQAAYGTLKTCDVESVQRRETRGAGRQSASEIHRHVWMAPGGKWRQQVDPGLVAVSDGSTVWRYNPQNREYTREPGRPDANPLGNQRILRQVASARVVREENLPVGGVPIACYVIEATLATPEQPPAGVTMAPIEFWIDKARDLILQQRTRTTDNRPGSDTETSVSTMMVTKAAVNQPVPDSVFEFQPPAGAVEVARFSNGPLSPLLGKSPPDFELKDTAGNSITPASLKGKLAILWFSPRADDTEGPFMEMLQRSFRDRGVAVVHVVGRPVGDLGAQMSRLGYSMPTAVAPRSMTAESMGFAPMGLSSLDGVIVLDRSGKVIYSGGPGPNEIQPRIAGALRANGIW